jgi:hypothetical protein
LPPRARDLDAARQHGLQHDLAIARRGRDQREHRDDAEPDAGEHQHVALAQDALGLRLAEADFHGLSRHQAR